MRDLLPRRAALLSAAALGPAAAPRARIQALRPIEMIVFPGGFN
jgi:hypothetical protein